MKELLAALWLLASAASPAEEIPPEVEMSFRQTTPVSNGRLELEVVLRSRASNAVTIASDISPLTSCGDDHFYFVLMVDGEGVRLPKYSGFCYRGDDITLQPGEEVSGSRIFDAVILNGIDTTKALVEFSWFERNSKGRGAVGVIEVR